MHALDKYLSACRIAHATKAATPETAFYPAFQSLLESAGGGLKPRVFCVMGLKNQGAGMPDGGFFTQDQFVKGEDVKLKPGQLANPSRGVVECKPLNKLVLKVADTKQVTDYWEHYNQVLVTNYREFMLIGRDEHGVLVRHEYYQLAATEPDFWALADDPAKAVEEHGDRLTDFLRRCLRRPAPLTEPRDLAWFLASYARDARGRIGRAADTGQLATVRKALEEALGIHVATEEGEHFFRSTLVQTLFYGVFAAWVLWHRRGATEPFDWQTASKHLHVPILRKLFRELTDPVQLEEWENTAEVMEWACDTLDRVDRAKFFGKFNDAEAVQYFYEPFLEAFDPELRKQLGVWYTPPEVVKYMVARVHQVLKDEFNRPDGLADAGVFVLDPCCGTGAYLVEVLNTIARVLDDKGEGSLLAGSVKKAAAERVFGFEILPAPFVVAHLQLGLLLQKLGAPLDGKKERAAVFLTNALTGWEPAKGPKQQLLFKEMEDERDAAEKIKLGTPILVVIGNPPYNGFADMPAAEDKGLVDPYRTTVAAPKPEGQGLNDLYVRFIRIAERVVTERVPTHGVVCYISNYSWLDGRSHTGIRERLLNEFDQVWIDNLNGDRFKNGKQTPEGKPDPSVFSTEHNREGIQVGTAIATLVRKPAHTGPAQIHYRDFWGEDKRKELLASGENFQPSTYEPVTPIQALGLPFRPMKSAAAYTGWPLLPELFPTTFPGIFTARDQFVVDVDEATLRQRMTAYFDPTVSHERMKAISSPAMSAANRFDPLPTRDALLKRGFLSSNIVRFAYRPFDHRWLYWEPETKLLNEKRAEYFPHVMPGNLWIAATKQNRRDFDSPLVLRHHATLHIIERGANLFPLLLRANAEPSLLEGDPHADRRIGGHVANITDNVLAFLNTFGTVADTPHLFHHAIAVMHAPSYAEQNGDALRQDWPRIPLPATRVALLASAVLGRKVAALLDSETPVDTVTAGKVTPAMKAVGAPTKTDGGQIAGTDLEVTARWGVAGRGGVTMPSTGKTTARPFTDDERAALGDDAVQRLGPDTLDVYLNAVTYWKNVPRRVWEYQLGGYQVLKKWLSYRERALLGRALFGDEVAHIRDTVRRIAALLLLGPSLDANYAAVAAAPFAWSPAQAPARLIGSSS